MKEKEHSSLDPIYKGILFYISEKKMVSPDEIATLFSFTRQAADYRLKKLMIMGLIKKRYVNGKVLYQLTEYASKILREEKSIRLKYKHKLSITKETASIIKKISLLPIALGMIGMGKFIAAGDIYRGIISFIMWGIITLILYGVISYIINKYIGK